MSETKPPAWAVEIAERMVIVRNDLPSSEDYGSIGIGPYVGDEQAWKLWVGVRDSKTARICAAQIREWIADALTVPEGHVRLPSGEVVKVSGTLPMTDDRCVVGVGAKVYHRDGSEYRTHTRTLWFADKDDSDESPVFGMLVWPLAGRSGQWFSTRAAAEAARSGGGA